MLNNALQKIKDDKKSYYTLFGCLFVMAYFVLYAIFGTRGILDYFSLQSELEKKSLIKDQLSTKIQNQQNLVDRMQNDSLDLDLLDEQVRKNLGYAKNNEIIIYKDKENE